VNVKAKEECARIENSFLARRISPRDIDLLLAIGIVIYFFIPLYSASLKKINKRIKTVILFGCNGSYSRNRY